MPFCVVVSDHKPLNPELVSEFDEFLNANLGIFHYNLTVEAAVLLTLYVALTAAYPDSA
jgi:hypothetical protein